MKTNVSGTSCESFKKLIENGKEGSQHKIIYYYVLNNFPCTRRQVSKATGIELGAVCGRANLLVKNKLLIEDKVGICQLTKNNVKFLEPAIKQMKFLLI